MLFVTACDHKYFDMLLLQIAALNKHSFRPPLVYDLGMTHDQLDILAAMDLFPLSCPPCVDAGYNYPNEYRPRALFKPMILLDAITDYSRHNLVYLDVDARPVAEFEFPVADVGLTAVENWDGNEYSGPYHSGVMFVAPHSQTERFLLAWAKDLWRDNLPSDKKSLNRVVASQRFFTTPLLSREYNSSIVYPETKIYHNKT